MKLNLLFFTQNCEKTMQASGYYAFFIIFTHVMQNRRFSSFEGLEILDVSNKTFCSSVAM